MHTEHRDLVISRALLTRDPVSKEHAVTIEELLVNQLLGACATGVSNMTVAEQVQAVLSANDSLAVVAPLSYSVPAGFLNVTAPIRGNYTLFTNNTLGNGRHLLQADANGIVAGQSGFSLGSGPRCRLLVSSNSMHMSGSI